MNNMKLPAVRPEVSSHKLFSTGLRPSSQCQTTSAMQCRGLGQNLDWLDLGRLGLGGWGASSPCILSSKETAEAATEPTGQQLKLQLKYMLLIWQGKKERRERTGEKRKEVRGKKMEEGMRRRKERKENEV
jgi:hypothetical protein